MPPRAQDERPSRVFRRSRRYREGAAELGASVRSLRQNRGWTLERASAGMGLDFRHLQQIEAGTINVTLATILRVADAFDVSPFVILPGPRTGGAKKGGGTNLEGGVGRPGRVRRVPALRVESPPSASDQTVGLYLPNPTPKRATSKAARRQVGAAVARFRRANELTQAQLAKRMHVSVQYVQKVEAGKQNLTIDSIVRFANALRVEPRQMFMLEG